MSIDRILRWFPKAWRARYEVEVRDLLDSHPFGWRERLDLIRACADAWLRQGAAWVVAFTRGTTYVGVRLAVLLAVGWLGVRGTEAFVAIAMGAEWQPPYWLALTAKFTRTFTWGYAALFVIRPYIEDLSNRPGRLETLVYTLVFALTVALDGQTANVSGVIWFGIFATMRHSWFHFGVAAGSPPKPHSVLGLR